MQNEVFMKDTVIKKSFPVILVEEMDYETDSILSKTIIDKTTGNVKVRSFDRGRSQAEETIPFDIFYQVIDGKAEIIIDGKSYFLNTGQSIIIPAHKSNSVNANERFKMIQTIIKSGYEA